MDRERAGCWQVTAQTNDAAVCRSPCGAAIPCATQADPIIRAKQNGPAQRANAETRPDPNPDLTRSRDYAIRYHIEPCARNRRRAGNRSINR